MQRSCPHIGRAQRPNGSPVYKDECTQCFDHDASPGGLNVCLTCFNGGCSSHAYAHAHRSGHPLILNIVRVEATLSDSSSSLSSSSQPQPHSTSEITKLAIGVAGGAAGVEAKKFVYTHTVRCLECAVALDAGADAANGLHAIVDAVERADSNAKAQEVAAWEQQLETCEHCLCLVQADPPPQLAAKALATCQCCDVADSLWLCMTCGALGCSRKNYDGSGGNGHAKAHFEQTGHPLVCKMGTITPEGKADLYCYSCDDSKLDEQLAEHLGNFGIAVALQSKTQKTMAELDLELNLNHDWTASYEQGKETPLVFGPGLCGLANLGNSCYMASVLQCVLPLEPFASRYGGAAALAHIASCNATHAHCFHCQMGKLAIGLASGRYSSEPAEFSAWRALREQQQRAAMSADSESTEEKERRSADKEETDKLFMDWQPGVAPRMFKSLIAGQHAEFKSNRQQDALDFFQYFLNEVQRREHAHGVDPTSIFQFRTQTRTACLECNRVRYSDLPAVDLTLTIPIDESLLIARKDGEGNSLPLAPLPPVAFSSCIQRYCAAQEIEYNCSHCARKTRASQSMHIKSFPEVLIVHMSRFIAPAWVPVKINCAIETPEIIDLEAMRGRGLQSHEQPMPDSSASASAARAAAPVADPEQVAALVSMGFSSNACTRAVLAVNSGGIEAASNWLFAHMEDANLNDDIVSPSVSAASSSLSLPSSTLPAVDEEVATILVSMGFAYERVAHALRQAGGNQDRALDWLFSHSEEALPSSSSPSSSMSSSSALSPNAGSVVSVAAGNDAPGRYQLQAFITHLGTSTGCGHYVCHVRQADGSFAYFNDAKVSRSLDLPKDQAYIYLFRRVSQ